MRGEDRPRWAARRSAIETPPRAWGRPVARAASSAFWGNTPTCVGKTKQDEKTGKYEQKHPHVRGEDKSFGTESYAATETPPRAWGRPLDKLIDEKTFRNTPTCVGKTPFGLYPGYEIKKHPHVRGEDAAVEQVP